MHGIQARRKYPDLAILGKMQHPFERRNRFHTFLLNLEYGSVAMRVQWYDLSSDLLNKVSKNALVLRTRLQGVRREVHTTAKPRRDQDLARSLAGIVRGGQALLRARAGKLHGRKCAEPYSMVGLIFAGHTCL